MNKENIVIGIPTKNRAETLKKTLITHNVFFNNYKIIVSVEENEKNDYLFLFNKKNIIPIIIPNNSGIGMARKKITEKAYELNKEILFFMDDNSKIINKEKTLNDFINDMYLNEKIIWLGAYNSIYDLFFNGKNKPDVFSVKFANSVFAIKIKKIMDCGNFDEKMLYQEDNDLNLRLVKKYGECIYVSKKILYRKKRHEDGGCTYLKNEKILKKIIKVLNDKHGFNFAKYSKKRNDVTIYWSKFRKKINNDDKNVNEKN